MRQNTVITKLLKTYTKMVGHTFLSRLTPVLEEIATNGLGYIFYEVDPAKIEPGSGDVQKNMINLDVACQEIMNFVFSSARDIPYPVKVSQISLAGRNTDFSQRITCHLCNEVVKRFPESKHIAISGFIFLRWMIPAISVKPEQNGLISKAMATPKASRVFLLIGKCLQMLANGLEFTDKEPHMLGMNDFIRRNMKVRDLFLDAVSTIDDPSEVCETLSTLDQVVNTSIPFILSHILDPSKNYENLQKILKSLKQYSHDDLLPEFQSVMLCLDDRNRKIFGSSAIMEITGLKVKKDGFALFKRKSQYSSHSPTGSSTKSKPSPGSSPRSSSLC
eukprot:TRINITY_DN2013_c0_g2_i2.p1 TRINITY_DN2013_c0_g2~~TRINITY_DN2013_c0_g2_i2.p1  ORF type:complete len:333 (+),score=64.19 TRINITY_DN2013_c0_g2_i2:353-1351(+)